MNVEQYLKEAQEEWDWWGEAKKLSFNDFDNAYNRLWSIVGKGIPIIERLQSENIQLLSLNAELEERLKEEVTHLNLCVESRDLDIGRLEDKIYDLETQRDLERIRANEFEGRITELEEEIAYLQLKEHNLNIQEEIRNGNI